MLLPTCNLDSFGVAVLPEGLVSASDEAGEEATGLHHDLAQGYIAGGVWQHRITLDYKSLVIELIYASKRLYLLIMSSVDDMLSNTFPFISFYSINDRTSKTGEPPTRLR